MRLSKNMLTLGLILAFTICMNQNSKAQSFPLSTAHGDWDANGVLDVLDIVHEINYAFRDGPPANPSFIGEINGVDPIDVLDVISLINYTFCGGPPPIDYSEPIQTAQVEVDSVGHGWIRNEILFELDTGLTATAGDSLIGLIGGIKRGEILALRSYRVEVPDTLVALQSLRASGKVRYALPHTLGVSLVNCVPSTFTCANDPAYLWNDIVTPAAYPESQQLNLCLNRVPLMWTIADGSDVTIGVIDNYATNIGELSGRISFAPRTIIPVPPALTHGTAVASLIGALQNNGIGITGVLSDCSIVFYTSGVPAPGPGSQVVHTLWEQERAINWFADIARSEGKHIVLNMSWDAGAGPGGKVIQSAIRKAAAAGVLMIAAAGNKGDRVTKQSEPLWNPLGVYPASFPEVLAVGCVDSLDYAIPGSGWGNAVLAASRPNIAMDNNDLATFAPEDAGTSFAAPVVAAIAAAVWCLQPSINADSVQRILINTSDTLYVDHSSFGFGRINAYRAVSAAVGSILPEVSLPGRPSSVVATADDYGTVSIEWPDVMVDYRGGRKDDIHKYHVYRRQSQPRTMWERLTGRTPAGQSNYSDVENWIPGMTYEYVVTAVDQAGQEGFPSSALALATPHCVTPPGSPYSPDPFTVALYHLDDEGLDMANDASGHGLAAAINGAATWSTEGRFGPCLNFDGIDDYISIPVPYQYNSDDATFEAWVRPTADSTNQARLIIDKYYYTYHWGRQLAINASGRAYALAHTMGADFRYLATSSTEVRLNCWTHLMAVFDQTNGRIKICVNGVVEDDEPLGAGTTPVTSIRVGQSFLDNSKFTGQIDEIRISNVARTP